MSDIDAISSLLQQAVYAAHPDYTTGSRPHCGQAAHQIDVSAVVRCYVPTKQLLKIRIPALLDQALQLNRLALQTLIHSLINFYIDKDSSARAALGGMATFRRLLQSPNDSFPISVTFSGSSRENMDLQLDNKYPNITVMRGGILKLAKMQLRNAAAPMISMPSWRRIGQLRDR